MNARRVATAFLAALLCSGLLTWVLSRQIAKPAPRVAAVPVRDVVVAAKAMQAGEVLDAGHLGTMNWPATQALPGAFDSAQQIVGRVLLFPMSPGEPVLEHELAAAGAGVGIAAKIPEGMRAISVPADEVSSVSGFVLPGCFVDVLAMYRPDAGTAPASRVVLERIRVLAVGQNTESDPQSKPSSGGTVTLLVTPQQAARLAQASSLGRVALVLRNGADQTTDSEAADLPPAAEAPQRKATQTTAMNGARLAGPVPAAFTVETIAGGKRTTQLFEGSTR